MKRIITVANRKGGVGKTTTVAAMASCLARLGYRVLVVDLDSQCNLSSNLGADVKKKNILDVMLLKCRTIEAIQAVAGFDIIAGSLEFGKINDALGNKTGREYRLLECLVPIKDVYDFCILDTPPELGLATANALTASDDVVITTTAESFSLDGVAQLYQSIRDIRRYTNNNLYVAGILVTIYNPRTLLSKSMVAELESMAVSMKCKLYKTTIRRSVAVAEAQNEEKDLFVYSGKSTTAKDYKKWVDEYLNNETVEVEE